MGRRSGFSLTEVMVSIAIVAMMTAILVPALDKAKNTVRATVCTSNLRQWGQIWKLYTDTHSFFPDRSAGTSSNVGAVSWFHCARDYYTDTELLVCPMATDTYNEGGRNPHMAWEVTLKSSDYYKGSYGGSLWVANGCGSDCSPGSSGPDFGRLCWRTPNAVGASYAPFLFCCQWKDVQPYPADEPLPYETDIWTPGPQNEMRRPCIKRHAPYNINILFLDWSVQSRTIKELWRLKWHREWPPDEPLPIWPDWMADVPDPP
ncbi:MAG: type II secretion system protein [Planctomycetota bacterium]